jgi:PAS domain-containing protein
MPVWPLLPLLLTRRTGFGRGVLVGSGWFAIVLLAQAALLVWLAVDRWRGRARSRSPVAAPQPLPDDGAHEPAYRSFVEHQTDDAALRESERLFHAVFDEAGTGISLFDLTGGRPAQSNRALQKMLRCTGEELTRFETFDALTCEENRSLA